jgi:serine phosphatase RsbU (regulator of sigma subunit)
VPAVILPGLYQVLLGTAILITPHWFSAAVYDVWRGYELLVGMALLLGGAGLLWVAILPVQRRAGLLAVYAIAAINFSQLALLFWSSGATHGGVVYAVLTLGTVLLGALQILPSTRPVDHVTPVRPLAIVIHVIALVTGLLMLLRPEQYAGPLYAPMYPWLPVFGTAFALLGAVLLARDLLIPARWVRAASLIDLVLAAFLVWWGYGFIATGAWTGVLTYALLTLGVIDTALLTAAPGWSRLSRSLGNPLRRRVALGLVTVLVGAAVALTLALTANNTTLAREDATDDDVTVASAVAEQLTTYLDTHLAVVAQVADLPSLEVMDLDRTEDALRDTRAAFPAFDNLSLVDLSGQQIVRATPGEFVNLASAPRVQRALSGEARVFGGVTISVSTGEPIVGMAAPVRSPETDAVIGAVAATIRLPSISAFLKETSLAQGRDVFVVDPDGVLVATSDTEGVPPGTSLAGTPILMVTQSGDVGSADYSRNGRRLLAGYAAVMPYDWDVVVEQPEATALANVWAIEERTYLVLLVASVLLTALAVVLVDRLFRPVTALIEPLRLLGQGRYDAALPVGADGEIGDLVHAVERMRGELRTHDQERDQLLAELRTREEERDQLLAELRAEFARTAAVQAQLLPAGAPDVPGYAFAGVCLPARQVGGDFFDWSADAAIVHIALGDVMGKGMAASLLTATARAALRAIWHLPPAEAVTAVNRALSPDLMKSDSFVTLFYAQLDPATGNLHYVDAGHGMALIQRQAGNGEPLRQHSLPLGVMPDAVYTEGRAVLAPGDTLLLYSDGLPDARPDLALDMAGVAAHVMGVQEARAKLDHLVALVETGGSRPDDLTLVVVERERVCPAARAAS